MTSFVYQDSYERAGGGTYCTCCRFTNGIDLPSPRDLTLKETKLEADRLATRILSNWTQLNGCLKRFEEVVQRRWLRKTKAKRVQILQEAWPGISRLHRPDFVGCRNKKRDARKIPPSVTANKRSQAFLWPYINLQDLRQGHLLLLFLKSRGREFPAAFVTSDLQNTHRGHGWPKDVEDGKPAMVFANGKTPRTYGRLINQKGSISQRVTRPAYPPIVGLFILEVQDGIYSFLVSCAQAILHDIDSHAWYTSPSMPEPEPPTTDPKRGETPWRSLPAFALESPYRRPQQLDIEALQTLVCARRMAAEDHLWLLREDPGYFVDNLREFQEHGIEQYDKPDDALHSWKHVAGKMMGDAFCSFMLWDELDLRLATLPSVQVQLHDANFKTGRLHPEDEATWAYLDTIIEQLIWIPMGMLDGGLPMSPRIRAISDIQINSKGKNHHWEMKPGRTDTEWRIYVLFYALFDQKQTDLHGRSNLVQEIQHTIDTEPEAADLLDPWVIDKFADVALLSEFQRVISTFEPWVRGWRLNKVVDKDFAVFCNIQNTLARDSAYSEVLRGAPCSAAKTLGIPTDGRFSYPADKERTKETTTQMRLAEQRLAEVWLDVGNYFRKKTQRTLWYEFNLRSIRTQGLKKTPKWIEPKKDDASQSLLSTQTPANALQELNMNAWHSKESDNKKAEILNSAKSTKVKLRRDARPDDIPTRPQLAAIEVPPAQAAEDTTTAPLKLPKRIYKVFAAMLPSGDSHVHAAKEVAWDELLYAFAHLGMQPEKLYGSVWVFKPQGGGACKVDVARSISFHEPREVRRGHKIPPNMVRTFGRRLKHAYGWEGGMFECE